MEKKTNTYSKTQSVAFWTACQKSGILSVVRLWTNMKFRDNYHRPSKQDLNPCNDKTLNKAYFKEHPISKHHDNTHGFICKANLKNECKKAGVNYNTFRNNIPRMVAIGLLIPTFTGWRVVSMKTAGTIVGVEITRLRIKAKKLDELKSKVTLTVILKSVVVQDKIHAEKLENAESILSLRTIASRTGFKSPTTISKRIAKLECQGKFKVKRSDVIRKRIDYWGNDEFRYHCNSYRKTA